MTKEWQMTKYIIITRILVNLTFWILFFLTTYLYDPVREGTALLAAFILISYVIMIWVISAFLKFLGSNKSNSIVVSSALCIIFLLSMEGGNNSWTVSIGVCFALSFYLIVYDGLYNFKVKGLLKS